MTTISYSLDDVNTIKNKGFNFKLSKATQELIMELSKLVGSPDYIKTPIFQKKKPGSEPDWNLLKQFKPTAKVERTDNEVLLQKIKGSLNKMTDKNYDSMRDEIMVNLGKLENTDLIQTVNDTIFNIASSNRFYSYIYAMLFKELIENSNSADKFQERLDSEINNYITRYLDINNINANEDYEAFCEANKESERRKALTEFFVQLSFRKIIDVEDIVSIHDKLCNLTLEHKFNEEHKQTIIEISENMFVMMKSGRPLFKDSGHLKLMNDKIAAISKLNVKQHPGLSNKACFKFMDIIDIKD
jgi:hypothetical protein